MPRPLPGSFDRVRDRCGSCGLSTGSPHASELLAVGFGSILAAAIRVADETGRRPLPLLSHHELGPRQLGARVIAHGPAHHPLASGTVPCDHVPHVVGNGAEKQMGRVHAARRVAVAGNRPALRPAPGHTYERRDRCEARFPFWKDWPRSRGKLEEEESGRDISNFGTCQSVSPSAQSQKTSLGLSA